ncbi:hybrid sensor histidine kinase/response regulator [Methylobrevis pamukkalensis]|uniref:histidine kinase n=1 Tax=Methylobrevis pamukkalensis TaxID=1439726 RepID=A0A1E3H6E4_9HYPH|nr:PAS domain S-box protein [Methylobrevis pamukkalensis]ODN71892.1 Blue-light-activated protein [Methylobrevis pamukkalensis]
MSRDLPADALLGGGETASLIREFDWGRTSLGAICAWPATVKAVVAMILRCPLPIVTLWGDDGVMIYNDAYSVFAGARHPALLGSKVREGWPEVADFNDHVVRTVFHRGETLSYEEQELALDRGEGPRQVWMNLDYSPIVGEDGVPLGVIAIVVETTAKVIAGRQLQDERMRLRQMYEQSASFMALLEGSEHRFVIVNPAYRKLVGERDVVGKTVAEVLPEAVGQGYVGLLDEVFRSGRPYRLLNSAFDLVVNADQRPERRFVDLIYQPITDRDGHVTSIFVNGIDVTDNIAAQEALRASEAQFRTFAQAMPNHVWAATQSGLVDWFNDRVYDYSGRTPEQLVGAGWIDVVHPDDQSSAVSNWQAALAAGEPYETEFRIRRADGGYRWHLVRALPIRNEAGMITRWIGTNTDIHQQKLAEVQSSRDLERIWNISPVLKLVTTPTGRITAVNPAWTRALGWTVEETVGRNVRDFVDPESRDRTSDRLLQPDAMARTAGFILSKDGHSRRIEWTSLAEDGTVYAFGRDITTEVETTAALEKSEAALIQAQKMEAIGQLTGGIAHDFNNLLQVVSGNLQLLAGDILGNTRAEQRVRNAMEGVTRGSRLASQLLAFGRRQPLAPKVVNLGRLVRSMDDILRRALGEAIEIETIIGGGLWNTYVDPGNIENALLNLSINARDAMEGRGKLTIEIGNAFLDDHYAREHADVASGQYVLLAVSDTGAGMPPELIAKVFEPFFTTKPEGKGSGLGLSMVYGFVKQSGGHVKIYSEEGEGTTIRLYLPRSTEVEDALAPREFGPITGGEETILVAEDDAFVRQTVVETLSGLGYRVLEAADANAALAILESGLQIDLLFTDVVMPGPLKSTDLARKAVVRLPRLKVLFTSGYTENSIVHGGRLDEGVELLSKPYTREALARKLRDLLGKPGESAAQTPPAALSETAMAERTGGAGLTILICEDEALIRMATVDLVEDLGHTVLEAGKGSVALELLANHRIDLLLTDVGLPDMDGAALARQARALHADLPIIFATGHQRLDGMKMDDRMRLLTKPFDARNLEEAIRVMAPGPA